MIRVGAAPGRSQAEEEWTNPKQSLPRTPLNTHIKYNMTRPSITLVHIGSVLTKGRPEGLPSLYSTPSPTVSSSLQPESGKKWRALTQGRLLQRRESQGGEPEKEVQEGNPSTSILAAAASQSLYSMSLANTHYSTLFLLPS